MITKNKFKNLLSLKVQAFVILVMMLFCSNTVFAQEDYTVFTAKQNISIDKVWNIKFSKDIDKNTVNSGNVKVVDKNGTEVKLNLSCSGNIISAKPIDNYKCGDTYTIFINNIKALSGVNLENPGSMKFTTKTGVQPTDYSDNYSLKDTHRYRIIDTLTFATDKDTTLSLGYNIGSLSNSPYQKELDLNVTGENAKITSEDSVHKKLIGNTNLKSGEKVQYQVIRNIELSGIKYTKDLSKTSGDYSSFGDYSKYTAAEKKIESDNLDIINKSKEIFNGITNPYYKAKKAYEFVNTYMNYDENNKNKGALNALNTSKGVCEDYSDLFVALLRASGVPARVVTGYWIDKESFSNNIADGNKNRHAWVEYYLPEYGWIVAEPTNIYYSNEEKIIDYDYFSNLNESSHFIAGYDSAGDNKDSNVYYNYEEGSNVTCNIQTQIEQLN